VFAPSYSVVKRSEATDIIRDNSCGSWTEKRNVEWLNDLLAAGKLNDCTSTLRLCSGHRSSV